MIDKYTFGEFVIDGKLYKSNIKLIQDKAVECRHFDNHIIKIDDFNDLIEQKPKYIIIGTGESGLMNVPQEIIDHLEQNNIKPIIEKTGDAVNTYNKLLKENKKVCAILHNTC